MALFGGSSKKMDTGALRNLLMQGLGRQEQVIKGGFRELPQMSEQYEQRQKQAGQAFGEASRAAAQNLAQGLQNVESPDFLRMQQAKSRELAFRDLPAAQQQIRESLAATGGLGRGVAVRALQQPVLQAQQTAADQGFALQEAAMGRDIQRREQALNQIYSTDQGVALQSLGIDQDIARTLLDTGRGDILNRAMQLANVEQQRTQGLLDIETLRQQQEIAADQQKRAQLGAILGTVGSLGGAALGAGLTGGNPYGAAIGSSVGGGLGGLAGGGTQPVDLGSILALRAFQQQNKPQFNPGNPTERRINEAFIRTGRAG